jgi:RecA-family ATPase
MKTDANDILRERGPDGLRQVFDETVANDVTERLSEAPPPNGSTNHGLSSSLVNDVAIPVPLKIISAASLANAVIPAREWLVPELIPNRTVTMLSGDGGVGKSLLAMQLAVAVSAGRSGWIGTSPEPGAALYVNAEDDLDEMHRRLGEIVDGHGLALDDLKAFHIAPLAGKDAVLGAPDRHGLISPTALWRAIAAQTDQIKPRLVILDNLADTFAGNENARPEARQFIGMLRGLANEQRLAVLIIAHPSLSGLTSGSGTSGSTAWSNSVRSRLYLDRSKLDDGQETDSNVRILRTMKANYAGIGGEIRIRWNKGCFFPDGAAVGFDRAAAEANADAIFLDLVAKFQAEGRNVSANPSPSFAPNVFCKHPASKGLTAKVLRSAMERAFAKGAIKNELFGPRSHERTRIVLAAERGEK